MKKLKGWPSWHVCLVGRRRSRLANKRSVTRTSLERSCSLVMHSLVLMFFAVSEGIGNNHFRGLFFSLRWPKKIKKYLNYMLSYLSLGHNLHDRVFVAGSGSECGIKKDQALECADVGFLWFLYVLLFVRCFHSEMTIHGYSRVCEVYIQRSKGCYRIQIVGKLHWRFGGWSDMSHCELVRMYMFCVAGKNTIYYIFDHAK